MLVGSDIWWQRWELQYEVDSIHKELSYVSVQTLYQGTAFKRRGRVFNGRGAMSRGMLVDLTGIPLLAYILARSSFNPRVPGSIPGSAVGSTGPRKLIDAGKNTSVSLDVGWECNFTITLR